MVPRIIFDVDELVNQFCHISVLYAGCLPDELSTGMLANKSYQERHSHLRTDDLLRKFKSTGPISAHAWYDLARRLMRGQDLEEESSGQDGRNSTMEVFLDALHHRDSWLEMWSGTKDRLEEYRRKFETAWSPASDAVLSRLAELSKSSWTIEDIHVHFVDCLYGGFAWHDCIAFAMLPDMEAQKKFITHELSELITPSRQVGTALQRAGLDPEIAHTVVDMLAYFSVRDFIVKPVYPNPERKGVVPNPNYYAKVEELYPLFEGYSNNPTKYEDFGSFIDEIVQRLQKP